jgi:ABC-2 type transport system permease protein
MKTFLAIIKTSFRRQMTYRAANLSGLVTNIIFGFFRASVLLALYDQRTSVNNFTIQAAITYAGLVQALIGYLSFFNWYDLMHTIYDGSVSADLLKPFPFFTYWLGIDIGRALGSFLIRSLPIFLIFALVYETILPDSLLQWIAVLISLILSLLLSFCWRFMVNLAAFWTPNAIGVGRFVFGLSWNLSGFFMPLDLFPDWIAIFTKLTPFGASVYTPVQIFTNAIKGAAMMEKLLLQLGWILILMLLNHLILSFGIRKLVIQGG